MNEYFSCDFFGNQTKEISKIEKYYEDYLKNFPSVKHDISSSGTSIGYFKRGRSSRGLITLQHADYGILLDYSVSDIDTGRSVQTWYSLGDAGLVSKIEEIDEGLYFPIGCFISPLDALKAIKSFLDNPESLPKDIEWIDSCDIRWPDNLFSE